MHRKYIKIMSLILAVICTFVFLPPVSADTIDSTYLYGSGDYLQQLKHLHSVLDTVMPSYFDIDTNGDLQVSVYEPFVTEARKQGFRVVPFVSNHFNKSAGHQALIKQEQLISQLVDAVKRYNLDGLNLDLENIPVGDKDLFSQFVKKLAAAIKAVDADLTLSIALPASEVLPARGWAAAYDYQTLAGSADYVILMTYDQHYEAPGPVASLPWVEKTIQTVSQVIPPEKLVLGLAFYGRYWINGTRSKELSHEGVLNIARSYMVEPKWDTTSQSPYLKFQDAGGARHEIWYENALSLGAKLGLIDKYNLAGAASWRLGLEDPNFWDTYRRYLTDSDSNKEDTPPPNRGEQREAQSPLPGQDNSGDNPDSAAAVFSDLTDRHWAAADIDLLYQQGLIKGYEDNTFRPKGAVTRAEVTAVLVRWLGLGAVAANNPFSDLPARHWAQGAVLTAVKAGFTGGYDDGTFRPDQAITRAELAALLARVYATSGTPGSGFSDVTRQHWAYEPISTMQGQGIVSGYADGSFRPGNAVTRAEFAAMLARIIRTEP